MTDGYVHGYAARESQRLHDQASALLELLHAGTSFADGSRVLEVGCGVGSQTVTLARRSPGARFTAIDVSAESLGQARRHVAAAGIRNVEFLEADIFSLAEQAESFDHAFVCFVLEHLQNPAAALQLLRTLLKPGGTITVIEGDHGSAFFTPDSAAARAVIDCLVELQRRGGGDAHLGRRLYPLLRAAGFLAVDVSPLFVYVDGSRPDLADAITVRTFTAMIEGARGPAVANRLLTSEAFDAGIAALHRTAEADGVFWYTFFKAVAHVLPDWQGTAAPAEHYRGDRLG